MNNLTSNYRKLIREEINRFLITEMITDKCYHFTDISKLKQMLLGNTIGLRNNVISKSEHFGQENRKFFLSVTRNFRYNSGYSQRIKYNPCRIILDGEKLNNNFRGRPINWQLHKPNIEGQGNIAKYYKYMQSEKDKHTSSEQVPKHLSMVIQLANNKLADGRITKKEYNKIVRDENKKYKEKLENYNEKLNNGSLSWQKQINVENEDRIFSKKPVIYPMSRYVKRIDIFLNIKSNGNQKDFAIKFLNEIPRGWINRIHFYITEGDFEREKNEIFTQKEKEELYTNSTYDKSSGEFVKNGTSQGMINEIMKIFYFICLYFCVKNNNVLSSKNIKTYANAFAKKYPDIAWIINDSSFSQYSEKYNTIQTQNRDKNIQILKQLCKKIGSTDFMSTGPLAKLNANFIGNHFVQVTLVAVNNFLKQENVSTLKELLYKIESPNFGRN